jgi:hypothetical protein
MPNEIKTFCQKGDIENSKRYLACGVCWIENGIAINTRQLRVLMGKSKKFNQWSTCKNGL